MHSQRSEQRREIDAISCGTVSHCHSSSGHYFKDYQPYWTYFKLSIEIWIVMTAFHCCHLLKHTIQKKHSKVTSQESAMRINLQLLDTSPRRASSKIENLILNLLFGIWVCKCSFIIYLLKINCLTKNTLLVIIYDLCLSRVHRVRTTPIRISTAKQWASAIPGTDT